MENGNRNELENIVDQALAGHEAGAKGAQFVHIAKALKVPVMDAPTGARDRAKAIMPAPVRRKLVAALLPPAFGMAGARSAASAPQLAFRAEETTVRLALEETPSGWELFGRAQPGFYLVHCAETSTETDENGKFTLSLGQDVPPTLTLLSGDLEIVLRLKPE